LARAHTTLAIDVLAEVAANGISESARIAAATALLDRAWGKPPVSFEVSEPDPENFLELLANAAEATRHVLAPVVMLPQRKEPKERGGAKRAGGDAREPES
jgi:hypothetical protein